MLANSSDAQLTCGLLVFVRRHNVLWPYEDRCAFARSINGEENEMRPIQTSRAFGSAVRQARKDRGLSQVGLAATRRRGAALAVRARDGQAHRRAGPSAGGAERARPGHHVRSRPRPGRADGRSRPDHRGWHLMASEVLTVLLDGKPIGTVERLASGALRLRYDDGYRHDPTATLLSVSMPPTEASSRRRSCHTVVVGPASRQRRCAHPMGSRLRCVDGVTVPIARDPGRSRLRRRRAVLRTRRS